MKNTENSLNEPKTASKIEVGATEKNEVVSVYGMPSIEIGNIEPGEFLVEMSSFYAMQLGANDDEIDEAIQPGKCLIVNGQRWKVRDKRIKEEEVG